MDVQKVSHDVLLNQWMDLVRQCRESGLPVRRWCRLNNISEQKYYYWLKKIRTKACESLPSTGNVFVPLNLSKSSTSSYPAAVLVKNDIRIEISNDISDDLLSKLVHCL